MDTINKKPALIGIGSFLAASLGVSVSASIDEDPNHVFLADAIGDPSNILSASEEEGECGEGKCGEDGEDGEEGECGEGKCGEEGEGECGEGKCGEEGEDGEDEEETEEE